MSLGAAKVGLFGASASADPAPASFYAGGDPSDVDTIIKTIFATPVGVTLGITLSAGRAQSSAMADSNVAGYVCGGTEGASRVQTVQKILFADDTISTLSSGFSFNTGYDTMAFSDSGTAGYGCGGIGSSMQSKCDKWAFPSDSRSTITSLSSTWISGAALADIGTAGYISGGYTVADEYETDKIDKYAFPGDARTTLVATLPSGASFLAAFADSGTSGYWSAGYGPSYTYFTNVTRKLAFASDTTSTTNATPGTNMAYLGGCAEHQVAGYVCGNNATTATAYKMAFSGDSWSTIANFLSAARNYAGILANSGAI